jgi:2-hydroxychromene-2-carboxylate isomerase
VQSFLRAVWAEDENIADDAVIRDVLAARALTRRLPTRACSSAPRPMAAIWNRRSRPASSARPSMSCARAAQRFWGQDRLDFLDRHLATL